jgi:hypothetical protein
LVATVGKRADGVSMFYLGRVHSIASESEGGKTWLALVSAAHELAQGNAVVYIDFEDDETGVVGRMLALGVPAGDIRDRFVYLKPDQPIGLGLGVADLQESLVSVRPTLCVLDGVTEAMSLHGFELRDNGDVAAFGRLLPGRIAKAGPAVVCLDHVTKDRETRGRYAIGGQHKLAGLNGCAYVLESRQPFGHGITGRSTVKIAKDRPGHLRRHALPSGSGLHWFADLILTSESDGSVFANVAAPHERAAPAGALKPTKVMAKVSCVLADNPAGLSKNSIEHIAGGQRSTVRTALELLVNEGYVRAEKKGSALVHFSIKPFELES